MRGHEVRQRLNEAGAQTGAARRWRLLPPALSYPLFRRYWLGLVFSVTGYRMFQFAQFWLAYELTESALYLGFVGLAEAVPAIFLNLLGGAAADRLDKRRVVIGTEFSGALVVAVLVVLVVTERAAPWHLIGVATLVSAFNSFNQPARLALYPTYVARDALMSAVALNTVVWQATRIAGPAIAGIVIAATGTQTALMATCAGMLGMALVMRTLPAPSPRPDLSRTRPFRDINEGLTYLRTNKIFVFLIGMTFFNSFFAMSFIPLMPAFAVDVLNVGVSGQGILIGVSGVGSLLVTLLLSARSSTRGTGALLIGGAVLTGSSLVSFALTSLYIAEFALAIALIFVTGMAMSLYMIPVMTAMQLMVPDRLRGRIMGLWNLTYNFMPLGAMFAGALAAVVGVPWAVAIGGFAVIAFALGPALLNPRVRALGRTVDSVKQARA